MFAVEGSSCIGSGKLIHSVFFQCELETLCGSVSSSDTKSLRLAKEVSSLESQLNDAKVTQ